MLKALSIMATLVMVVGVLGLLVARSLFSASPVVVAVQVAALALLIWARVTFGVRSFHFAATATEGGLVTTGPYRYIRHPIYTACCLFAWAGVVAHWSSLAGLFGVLVLLGAVARMSCEEVLLAARYPEYRQYAASTRRMIPYVF